MIADEKFAKLYSKFAKVANTSGVDAARRQFEFWTGDTELLSKCEVRFREAIKNVQSSAPPIIAAGHEAWYSGPQDDDTFWPATRDAFINDNWTEKRIEDVDRASNAVVAHTPPPTKKAFNCHGLVVGHVQSGKTSNYIAVISKMADLGYRLIIVLAGIHNGLRRQTQERLQQLLQHKNGESWHTLTSPDEDFRAPGGTNIEAYLSPGNQQRILVVIKKNSTVLDRFFNWMDTANGRDALNNTKVLIIDDEGDQASVETSTINPKILRMLSIMPKHTYIAYTATPFANVFIDPNQRDLYPKDFILNLPRPSQYFGPKTVFGINRSEEEDGGNDGLNVVRHIPDESLNSLRPTPKEDVNSFIPKLTKELKEAIHWFWLSTAARYARGDRTHSTMLIHTSSRTTVHDSFKQPISNYIRDCRELLDSRNEMFLTELRSLWITETENVPASIWGRTAESFEKLLPELTSVFNSCKPIIENGGSEDRLDYSGAEPVVAIVIGGNTLARGLTLEGLIVSVFVRDARQYDTLLQMGRWFGYRVGYEDLPRIWTTTELEQDFRHLAFVEEEMRSDIDRYQEQDCTPLDLAVRIHTHPTLCITRKMGAAAPANVSYAGSRLQTRYFYTQDTRWLTGNLTAAKQLAEACQLGSSRIPVQNTAHQLFRNIDAKNIHTFLQNYQIHPDSSEFDRDLVLKFIDRQTQDDDHPMMKKWNVLFFSGPKGRSEFEFEGFTVNMITRSRIREGVDNSTAMEHTDARSDIKTLMSKRDICYDIDPVPTSPDEFSESDLFQARRDNPATCQNGLLVIYTIDPNSQPDQNKIKTRAPLNAKAPVIGVGMAFPETVDKSRSTQMAVKFSAPSGTEHPNEEETQRW